MVLTLNNFQILKIYADVTKPKSASGVSFMRKLLDKDSLQNQFEEREVAASLSPRRKVSCQQASKLINLIHLSGGVQIKIVILILIYLLKTFSFPGIDCLIRALFFNCWSDDKSSSDANIRKVNFVLEFCPYMDQADGIVRVV